MPCHRFIYCVCVRACVCVCLWGGVPYVGVGGTGWDVLILFFVCCFAVSVLFLFFVKHYGLHFFYV